MYLGYTNAQKGYDYYNADGIAHWLIETGAGVGVVLYVDVRVYLERISIIILTFFIVFCNIKIIYTKKIYINE